jgi:hypothetical protein
MLRTCVSAVVALLLVVGVTLAQEKRGERRGRGNRTFGKIVSLDLKDGAGTLTVMARSRRDEEAKEMKFKVTKDTKFGKSAGRGKPPTPIEADKVADTFKKDTIAIIHFEKSGDDIVAKSVNQVQLRRRNR